MRKIVTCVFGFFCLYVGYSQTSDAPMPAGKLQRPKIVIGIVVDQMRWDYLYRYYDLYQDNGGFKRLLSQGFSCENTLIPYTPTVTACGHTSIYTGSVPAVDGITGNDWWDYQRSQMVYCTEDSSERTIGSSTAAGKMSPRNLLVTTLGDEMHLASNFHSKVIGIALKDRAAILPAGHSADGAYWYDEQTGDWITSSYYKSELPAWVKKFNARKLVDTYYAQDWNTLYPLSKYVQSAPDEEPYEFRPFGAEAKGFPYSLKQFQNKNYEIIAVTPYGNTFTFEMAKAAISGEQLGTDSSTDILTISLSSPDYIGHTFGPNSVEAEDNYLRLDRDLGSFMAFLDKQFGAGQYLAFLSADHGVAQVPAFLREHKIPAGNFDDRPITAQLNALLQEKFKAEKLVIGILNYQVYLNREAIGSAHLDKGLVEKEAIDFLAQQPGIDRVFSMENLNAVTLTSNVKSALANGYYPPRSGDIQLLFKPQWIEGFERAGTTHGVWNPYDSHIPLIWFGWNIAAGKTNREVYMTDIAPTIAALLHIQMPSGSVGHVIGEVSK